jgi:crotonobetainyl-CoA:carnitine CoA-transferase CaiB-like acyl-CoA transferase
MPRRDRAAGSRCRRGARINPAIVYAQVKGFGAGSPYGNNPAFEMMAQACGGTMSITGPKDGPPMKPGPSLGDTRTGMLLAISVVSALFRRTRTRTRTRTGPGEHLQVAMQDALLHYIRGAFAAHARSGKPAPRAGSPSLGASTRPAASSRTSRVGRTTSCSSIPAVATRSTGRAC